MPKYLKIFKNLCIECLDLNKRINQTIENTTYREFEGMLERRGETTAYLVKELKTIWKRIITVDNLSPASSELPPEKETKDEKPEERVHDARTL